MQEIYLPLALFADLVERGAIQPDGYYPGGSFCVPPGKLAIFNEALKEGTANKYYPEEPS
jgi:hypothetical protein